MTSHRNTILVEDAEILEHTHHDGDQHILRVQAPNIAQRAQAGSFAHISCHPLRPMRRPISIMRVNKTQGHMDFLYKAFGEGTALLAEREVGEKINIMGPIGNPFVFSEQEFTARDKIQAARTHLELSLNFHGFQGLFIFRKHLSRYLDFLAPEERRPYLTEREPESLFRALQWLEENSLEMPLSFSGQTN